MVQQCWYKDGVAPAAETWETPSSLASEEEFCGTLWVAIFKQV